MNTISIYTDGSCRKNPGPGGYGVVVLDEENNTILKTFSESCDDTTNNREELKAIIVALECTQLTYRGSTKDFVIYTDSAYCVGICNDWIYKWAGNCWRKANNQAIENADLIKTIYGYLTIPFNNFEIKKINGHSGVVGNELADALATSNQKKYYQIVDERGLIEK
jgi:ribonuclease HI